jgi:hypothetical protein
MVLAAVVLFSVRGRRGRGGQNTVQMLSSE